MSKVSLTAIALSCLFLVSAPVLCLAQNASQTTPGVQQRGAGRGEKVLEKLTAALDLTPEQVAQIKPILAATRSKAMQIFNDSTLTDEQKKAQIKELRRQEAQQIKPILTSDQIAKWKAILQQRRSAQS